METLPDDERNFVRAAESDETTALIYADWLEDRGRDEEAAQIRMLWDTGGFSDRYRYGYGYGYGYG